MRYGRRPGIARRSAHRRPASRSSHRHNEGVGLCKNTNASNDKKQVDTGIGRAPRSSQDGNIAPGHVPFLKTADGHCTSTSEEGFAGNCHLIVMANAGSNQETAFFRPMRRTKRTPNYNSISPNGGQPGLDTGQKNVGPAPDLTFQARASPAWSSKITHIFVPQKGVIFVLHCL